MRLFTRPGSSERNKHRISVRMRAQEEKRLERGRGGERAREGL